MESTRETLVPGENGADPLLDARVSSVQKNSTGDRHGLVGRFQDFVLFLWCCKFMSEHSLHPLAHHSRFVQLSGLLPTDPAAQEHELLCRAIVLVLTFDQLQGAELSCFELLARRSQMLEMKFRDKTAGSFFGSSIEEHSHIYLGTGQTRGFEGLSAVGAGTVSGPSPMGSCSRNHRCGNGGERRGVCSDASCPIRAT